MENVKRSLKEDRSGNINLPGKEMTTTQEANLHSIKKRVYQNKQGREENIRRGYGVREE